MYMRAKKVNANFNIFVYQSCLTIFKGQKIQFTGDTKSTIIDSIFCWLLTRTQMLYWLLHQDTPFAAC